MQIQLQSTLIALLATQIFFSAPAQAQQSSSASQTVRSWQLIDLDPDDGIAPSIRFTSFSLLYSIRLSAENNGVQENVVADRAFINHVQPWQNTYSYQNRSISMQYSGGNFGTISSRGVLAEKGAFDGSFWLTQDFVLSPNTILMLDVRHENAVSGAGEQNEYQNAYSYVSTTLRQRVNNTSQFHSVDTGFSQPGRNEQHDFSIGFYNLSDHEQSNSYEVRLSAAGAYLTPPIPGVPEAETWAMLLGGLGLCGWAARRRRSAR